MESNVKREYRRKKLFFQCYNVIFDVDVSQQAKLIYCYLSRLADNETGVCFPSHSNIMQHTGIKSRVTVKESIIELEKIGLVKKEHRFFENGGGQRSNSYIVYDDIIRAEDGIEMPSFLPPPDQQVITPRSENDHPLITSCTPPDQEMITYKYLDKNTKHERYLERESEREKENTHTHTPLPSPSPDEIMTLHYVLKNVIYQYISEDYLALGAYLKVRMAETELHQLIREYGDEIVADYIKQLDFYMASEGKSYKSHSAQLRRWIRRDMIRVQDTDKAAAEGKQPPDLMISTWIQQKLREANDRQTRKELKQIKTILQEHRRLTHDK